MATLSFAEGEHALGFVVSEANGFRSREVGVMKLSQLVVLPAGTVLCTISGEFSEMLPGETDGQEIATAVLAIEVDATAAADEPCVVIIRDAEINLAELIVEPSDTPTQGQIDIAVAELAALGIIARAAI